MGGRFYAWLEPAATFGYFQRFAEVERMTLLRPLLRRPTGGGLVPHAADWTDDTPDGVLEPGMVVCVESYIGRLGGHEGVKLEDQVLITENGHETLSRYPLKLTPA